MKNSSDTIRKQTRDLLACSAVLNQLHHCVALMWRNMVRIKGGLNEQFPFHIMRSVTQLNSRTKVLVEKLTVAQIMTRLPVLE